MSDNQIIIIETTESGDIQYKANPKFPMHTVIGALQVVKKVLEARMISDVLSDKDTDKAANHDSITGNTQTNPS